MVIFAIGTKFTSSSLQIILAYRLALSFWKVLCCAILGTSTKLSAATIAGMVVAATLPEAAGARAEVVATVRLARPLW